MFCFEPDYVLEDVGSEAVGYQFTGKEDPAGSGADELAWRSSGLQAVHLGRDVCYADANI